MAPSTMKALAVGKRSWSTILYNGVTARDISHGASIRDDIPVPQLEANEILVRVRSVALNPTDWKHMDLLSPPDALIGCDYAGEVVELGSAVPKGAWNIGDRVAGVAHGGLYKDQGAFAEYLRIPHDLAFKPGNLSNQEATTYGVSAITAMLALYHTLDLPWPDQAPEKSTRTILIYAGSTCAGLFAIQMAKHAGLTVLTTCSPRNFSLVKSFGADAVFDYSSKTLVSDIVAAHPDVSNAMDCFSEGHSAMTCAKIIAANNGSGRVITLLPKFFTKYTWPTGVVCKDILAYTLTGRPFQVLAPLGPKFKAIPEDRAALVRFYAMLPELTEWLRPNPIEVLQGGFEALLPGEERLKSGNVSGMKLVVDLA